MGPVPSKAVVVLAGDPSAGAGAAAAGSGAGVGGGGGGGAQAEIARSEIPNKDNRFINSSR